MPWPTGTLIATIQALTEETTPKFRAAVEELTAELFDRLLAV